MKSYIYAILTLLLAAGFSSCEKPVVQEPDPILNMTALKVSAMSSGGEVSISYSVANPIEGEAVSVKIDDAWISCKSIEEKKIILDVDKNTGEARTSVIGISYRNAESASVTVMQDAAGESIRISAENFNADAEGGEVGIEVTSDRDWTLESETGTDWITVSAFSGKSGETVKFTAAENLATEARTARFTFRCATNSVIFTMSQDGKPSIIDMVKDPVLKAYILEKADSDNDGKISEDEAISLKAIDYPYTEAGNNLINTLEGLEYFTGLESIILPAHEFATADFSTMPNLEYVDLSRNGYLGKASLKGCSSLEYLSVALAPYLESLDLEGCSSLKTLYAFSGGLSSIDVSTCPMLEELIVYSNSIGSIDLTSNTRIVSVNAGSTELKSLVLPETNALSSLSVYGSSSLSAIDLTYCTNLKTLDVSSCPVSSLALGKCIPLERLTMTYCKRLTSIDVSKNMHLTAITATSSGLASVTTYEGQWEEIKDNSFGIQQYMIKTVPVDYPEDCSALITDSGLRNYILTNYDTDADGKISGTEAQQVKEIVYSGKGLSSFDNFVYFRKIEKLDLSDNALGEINIGVFAGSLVELNLSGNRLKELSLAGVRNIRSIDVSNNSLTSCTGLTSNNNGQLERINMSHNSLTEFQCAYSHTLKEADLSYNKLKVCNLEYSDALVSLNVSHNSLTQETNSFVRPYTFTSIETIDLGYNNFGLVESDVKWTENWPELTKFVCTGCQILEEVDLSTNSNLNTVEAKECPRLGRIVINSSCNPRISRDSNTEIVYK
ncbi:MAG: hypothetical protein NC335_12210 [Bacteroides sp.]|nr:hypothetical protein [Bacteroides sp.]